MDSLNPQAWHELYGVAAGASAALLGLVLVAISLHLRDVEKHPVLRNRARLQLMVLAMVLILSLVDLIPDITAFWLGVTFVAVSLGYLVLLVRGIVGLRKSTVGIPFRIWRRLILQNLFMILPLATGTSLMLGQGPGLYFNAPALALGFPVVLANVWALLFAPELHPSDHATD